MATSVLPLLPIVAHLDAASVHDHVCVLHSSAGEHLAIVVPLIQRALATKEQCIYIAERPEGLERILGALESAGIAVGDAVQSRALSPLTSDRTYLHDGDFDPDRMLAWVDGRAAAASESGFAAMRIMGEMISVASPHADFSKLHAYESRLNYLVRDRPLSAMCVYDRARFEARDTLDAFATHQRVAFGATLYANPHFVSPDAYLGPHRLADELQWFIDQMVRRGDFSSAADDSAARLRIFAGHLLQTQEAERRALARQLHDDLGQIIASIHFDLEAALDNNNTRKQAWASARAAVDDAIEAVRDLALELRPATLDDIGLVAAVRSFARLAAERGRLIVRVDASAFERSISSDLATTILRVAQEAIENVVRHAGARNVTVALTTSPGTLGLVVSDDGQGFDVPAALGAIASGQSMGLLGMKERCALANGRLWIESKPHHGTSVTAELPLANESVP